MTVPAPLSDPPSDLPPTSLSHEAFVAAVGEGKHRFQQLRDKHPALKGYLVLALAGKQAGIGASPRDLLKDFPSLMLDGEARARLADLVKIRLPQAEGEAAKKKINDEIDQTVPRLLYDGKVQVEVRFDNLDYELIRRLRTDEFVDRQLTPQTDASIRIVIGSLACLAGGGAGEEKSPADVIN